MLAANIHASQVFQYAVTTRTAPGTKSPEGRPVTAYLWVPPDAEYVRGVLIGGRILMEPDFVYDPVIRAACVAESLGIVYFAPHFSAIFPYRNSDVAGEMLERTLADLAEKSGYAEVEFAPLLPFGHSVATIFASHVLKWKPARCFGVITFKGGFCVGADELEPLRGIPSLNLKGQFEEFGGGPSGVLRDFETREASWKGSLDTLLHLRATDEQLLLGYVVESGSTHMAWTGRLSEIAAGFIRAAARLRIPADRPEERPVVLKRVELDAGVLVDGDFLAPKHASAPPAEFDGPATNAFWFPSAEIARKVETLHVEMRQKRPQFVTFATVGNNRPIFVRHDMRMGIPAHWTGPDTFRVSAIFLDEPPKKYAPVEGKAGHAPGEIRFQVYGSALEQLGPDLFRVRHDPRAARPCVLAFHPGNATYRYAEQPARVGAGPSRGGADQSIRFELPETLAQGGFPLSLAAKSDSGLPVRFWVDHGPAEIGADNVLRLTEIPERAKWPLEIAVVAHQPGSQVEPKVRAAETVHRVLRVER